jgi:hypothetical protein
LGFSGIGSLQGNSKRKPSIDAAGLAPSAADDGAAAPMIAIAAEQTMPKRTSRDRMLHLDDCLVTEVARLQPNRRQT